MRDGGTLQIGIGSMGDALTAALLARQGDNAGYKALLDDINLSQWAQLIDREGGTGPFAKGLSGCSARSVSATHLRAHLTGCSNTFSVSSC